jgi:hypothetical protein
MLALYSYLSFTPFRGGSESADMILGASTSTNALHDEDRLKSRKDTVFADRRTDAGIRRPSKSERTFQQETLS